MEPTRPLDAYKARYLARIESLKQLILELQGALAANPELRPILAEELRALLGEPAPEHKKSVPPLNGASAPRPARDESSVVEYGTPLRERMANFFRARRNEPASIDAIFAAVGGAESSVRGMLYKKPRNNGWFVRVEVPDKADHWRLSDERLTEAAFNHDFDAPEDSDTDNEVTP